MQRFDPQMIGGRLRATETCASTYFKYKTKQQAEDNINTYKTSYSLDIFHRYACYLYAIYKS